MLPVVLGVSATVIIGVFCEVRTKNLKLATVAIPLSRTSAIVTSGSGDLCKDDPLEEQEIL
jgi:hypothetical protein